MQTTVTEHHPEDKPLTPRQRLEAAMLRDDDLALWVAWVILQRQMANPQWRLR